MVCIIDDREDVWNMATNLIQVKPYHFFQHTGDINAPPGMSKHELDGKGVDFADLEEKAKQGAIDKEANKALEAAESTENAKKTDDQCNAIEVGEAEAKDGIPKTPEHVTDDNIETGDDYSPESAGGDDDTPDAVEDAKKDNDCAASEEASETSASSSESKVVSVDENNENVIDKPDSVIKSPPDPGDDNLIEIEDPDDYLLYLEAILMKIHKRFYEYYDENKQVIFGRKFFPS